MKRLLLMTLSAFAFLVAVCQAGEAEPVARSLGELQNQLKVGGTIFVTDRQGRETRGKLSRLSSTSLVIVVNGDEREIQSPEIGRIETLDPVWNGALIGGAILGVGGMGGAGTSCSPHCVRDVTLVTMGAAVVGALLGARLDRGIEGRRLVYGTQPASRHTFHPKSPVASFGEIWMRARSGDTLYVLDTSGRETTGAFARASASSIALLVDGHLREMPESEVRQVERRGSHLGTGVLIGAGVLAIGCVINVRYGDGQCRKDPVGSALAAVGAGALIGRLIPKRTVVYRSTGDRAADAPVRVNLAVSGVLVRQRKAVGLAISF